MADNKANALKEANSIKLIIGTSPEDDGGTIDITDAVVQFYGHKMSDAYDLAHSIIGIEEDGNVSMLRSDRVFLFIEQELRPVIEASIVNAAQKEAILRIIHNILMKYANECQNGAEYVAHVLN